MRKITSLGLGLAFIASNVLASNTGFKLNYPLTFTVGKSQNNWLSVPYFYFPNGNVGQTPQNSIDICNDLNGGVAGQPKVVQVIRFQPATDTPKTQPCASTIKAFDIVAAEGYSVKPKAAGVTIDIVGSHDDTFAPNKNGAPGVGTYPLIFTAGKSENNWFSVPYHSKANNSLDVCAEFKAQTTDQVSQFIRFQSALDTPKTQPCASTIKAFDLVPGEGYSVKPKTTGVKVALDVY